MHIVLGIVVVIVLFVIIAFVISDAVKSNYHGIPIPVSKLVSGKYKVLGYVKAETGETFAVMERTEDEEIMCVNVTPLKEELFVVGNIIPL